MRFRFEKYQFERSFCERFIPWILLADLNCSFVKPLATVFVKFAPLKFAFVKFAFFNVAFAKFAFVNVALSKLALARFRFEKSQFERSFSSSFIPWILLADLNCSFVKPLATVSVKFAEVTFAFVKSAPLNVEPSKFAEVKF